MPLKVYCPSCSEPNEYTLIKPSFCSFCGSKFSGSINAAVKAASPVKPAIKPVIAQKVEIEDDLDNTNYTDDTELPNISKLVLDIELDIKKEKGLTLGEVMKEQKTGFAREKGKKVNKKKEFEKFLEEARNTKKPIEIIDGGPE